TVDLELVTDEARIVPMMGDDAGRFSVYVPGIGAGARYLFRVNGQDGRPDPYSRFQPEGVHGPSEVVDPSTYRWQDHDWPGLPAENQVVYELHVGAMTPDGIFRSLIGQLESLKTLGVTTIELMPVAQCPGERNWGYDGVDLFAPSHAYGSPDDLRALVDAAHGIGLGVILDVVYNHLGPEGNYLGVYATAYFSEIHETAWGAGLNWDGPGSEFVRRFAIDNACQWVAEYHIDGFRLDATHAIVDDSPVHILQEMTARVRELAGDRDIFIVAEDGRHEITRARSLARGGEGLNAIWADDFHHELRVHLTNAHENYYARYSGATTDIAATINGGFGPVTEGAPETTPVTLDDPASAFVFCIQNHDQVGNRPFGDRIHHEISVGRYAAASALLLFAPETPLLFMGQEFAASTPFLYFTDHPEELGTLVTKGRREEFSGFPVFHDPELVQSIPDPQAESTFLASKLRLEERERHAGILALYAELLRLRREDNVLRHNDRAKTRASAISAEMVTVDRWWGMEHRLLVANFGPEAHLAMQDVEAFAPIAFLPWSVMVSTTEARFDGDHEPVRTSGFGTERQITIPARSAVIFAIGI
ncbi:MAG TPA: malto-oligosyltrehalose trehalohydrolase, partial [Thermomicrobiales bacterium]|nr:malto-oligosyltrehalose trehalohydrolase [Thermomicrobiales bacterium]